MCALTTILTIFFWVLSFDDTSFEKDQGPLCQDNKNCTTERDSLTKKIIYITVDKGAVNEGGEIALLRQYEKITLDSIPDDLDTKFIIAFIVQADGKITGERVIKDKTGVVGQQMIKIARSFKWMPAECNGQKVPMLVKLPLQMCLQ